jgi:uncharacterized secreted repeat protein (TIGR03808 family)
MTITRRRLLAFSAAVPAAATIGSLFGAPARAASSIGNLGLDASHFGIRPGSPDDQSRALQRALEQAATSGAPLALPPGVYRAANLAMPAGTHLIGMRRAARLVLGNGDAILTSRSTDRVTLDGVVLDGGARPVPNGGALLKLASVTNLRILDCDIRASGGAGLGLDQVEGEVRGCTITSAAEAGLHSLNARGLTIAANTLRGCGNNGILVWRSEAGDDGTLVTGNRIEQTGARSGGSGQNGNAINVFRAGNVIVSGNRINGAAFSAVRGNAASNLQVLGNNCVSCGEVALYAEFGFEGAILANNVIDGAAIGIAVTNFNHGGRLAVVQGNLIRNLLPKRPAGTDPADGAGIGIGVEADTAVTGNVIEGAPTAGISVGWGRHLRDVSVTGNVIRSAGMGIAVSVSSGAGAVVIADNLIADARQGAIVGMELKKAVTGDLARDGAGRHAQLAISGNRVR